MPNRILALLICLFISAPSGFCQQKGTSAAQNYHYHFSTSCNCVISDDNPNGIEEVIVFPYDTDPDIHLHNCGYYWKTTKNMIKEFSLIEFNPTDFTCQPCHTFIPGQHYVFMFKGKPGMDDISIAVFKDTDGKLKQAL